MEVSPILDHAHQLIIKLTLAFLNLYQHAKKSAHFINSLFWDIADLKDHAHFWPQPPKSK